MPFQTTELMAASVPPGESRRVMLGEQAIGLFHQASGFFAIADVCPHRGAPLHEGFVHDGVVTCPWHQWNFNLADGTCKNIPGAKVQSFPVEVREGAVWIDA